jgi:hypothetical protein
MNEIITKYCELYVCNNKWIEVIKDIPLEDETYTAQLDDEIPLSFDIEKLQDPYDDNNNMITYLDCSEIDERYRGSPPRWKWPPNRKNEEEAAAELYSLGAGGAPPRTYFKLFYILLMMIFKILITRNVFILASLTKLKNMIDNFTTLTTPFWEAVRRGEIIPRRGGRSVTTLKRKLDAGVAEFKNFLRASDTFGEISEADPTKSILEIFPSSAHDSIQSLKLNELYKDIINGVKPDDTELETIGDNVAKFFTNIVTRATTRS